MKEIAVRMHLCCLSAPEWIEFFLYDEIEKHFSTKLFRQAVHEVIDEFIDELKESLALYDVDDFTVLAEKTEADHLRRREKLDN